MDFNKIKHIVFSSDIEELEIVKEAKKMGINCHCFLDARSAIYGATGIAAQNKEKVIALVNGDNTSRSAYTGMTEAFYRNLPVVLITLSGELDYSVELGDVINGHYRVHTEKELETLLMDKISLPAHIEYTGAEFVAAKKDCLEIQKVLFQALTTEDYLYFGSNITFHDFDYSCKVVQGGMPNCYDGALANVLGASLAKQHKRYVGVVTEKEFLHDMNTLGNININDSLIYVVIADYPNRLIADYAMSLGFGVEELVESQIDVGKVQDVLNQNVKYIIMVSQEK